MLPLLQRGKRLPLLLSDNSLLHLFQYCVSQTDVGVPHTGLNNVSFLKQWEQLPTSTKALVFGTSCRTSILVTVLSTMQYYFMLYRRSRTTRLFRIATKSPAEPWILQQVPERGIFRPLFLVPSGLPLRPLRAMFGLGLIFIFLFEPIPNVFHFFPLFRIMNSVNIKTAAPQGWKILFPNPVVIMQFQIDASNPYLLSSNRNICCREPPAIQ